VSDDAAGGDTGDARNVDLRVVVKRPDPPEPVGNASGHRDIVGRFYLSDATLSDGAWVKTTASVDLQDWR